MADKWSLVPDEFMRQTNRGEFVRSRSEELIANKLHARGLNYGYEQPLCMITGRRRFPDFTIADRIRGVTYYWEHFRALTDPAYRERCKRNHDEYLAAGIRPWQEGGGSNRILIETHDKPDGGLDAAIIDRPFRVWPSKRGQMPFRSVFIRLAYYIKIERGGATRSVPKNREEMTW